MVKYSFDVDDKDKVMQDMLSDEMVNLANKWGLILTISYKKFGEPRYQPEEVGKKIGIEDWTQKINHDFK